MTEDVLAFKPGAHPPKGVTPQGVLKEREIIVKERGAATASLSADAALSEPDRFPNLRPWGAASPEEAMRESMERGIRHAYNSIVLVRIEQRPQEPPRERYVRFLHAVPEDGQRELVYQPLTLIRERVNSKRYLITKLRREAENYSQRLTDTLSELEEVVE